MPKLSKSDHKLVRQIVVMPKLSKSDHKLIRQIAERAIKMDLELNPVTVMMDIIVCHFNSPLRLDELLGADDINFAHDIVGINKNLNRKTGKLCNHFTPRYSCSSLIYIVCSYNEDKSISIDKAFLSKAAAEKETESQPNSFINTTIIEDMNDFILTSKI